MLTKELLAWYNRPQEDKKLEEGAMLLLKVKRNRNLYISIVKRSLWSRLNYEIRKILVDRGEIVSAMEEVIDTSADTSGSGIEYIEKILSRGMRSDHESLPDEIQDLYVVSTGELFPLIRSLHEKIKLMEESTDQERAPLTQEILEAETKARQMLQQYDQFTAESVDQEDEIDTATIAKEIGKYRKALTDGRKILSSSDDAERIATAKLKMKTAYEGLLKLKASVSDGTIAFLKDNGVI